jgi:acetyl esterase
MPVKPEVQAILDIIGANQAPLAQQTPASRRESMRRSVIAMAPMVTREEVASVVDRVCPGPGGDMALRVYTPEGTGDGSSLPMLVWFHGGGWVTGDLETADFAARVLANAAGVVVVSVDYRLAPENPFPAAVDDALAAVRWVADNGHDLGGDAKRLAVGGESAGANLAAVACQQLRDLGPAIRAQLLVYPQTDQRFDSPSIEQYAEGYYNTKESLLWHRKHYLGDDESLYDDPRAAPLRAQDDALAGLPPALVITAEFDPVRDEGEAYGERLHDVGVETTIIRFDGMIHGFYAMRDLFPEAATAIDRSAGFLRRTLQ